MGEWNRLDEVNELITLNKERLETLVSGLDREDEILESAWNLAKYMVELNELAKMPKSRTM